MDNFEEKQSLFLLKIKDHVVDDQAEELRILKKKDKKSFRFQLKDLNHLILGTNQDPNNHFYNYLCYMKARYRPENKKIAEQ